MNAETTIAPAVLAMQVALRIDDWTAERGCPAWIDSADRGCGRTPAHDYLCKRHHTVALRRYEKAKQRAVKDEETRRVRNAEKLPDWRAELERVDAEMARRDPELPGDRAAYTGVIHPTIQRQRARLLSDSNVERMAFLVRRREQLVKRIRRAE